MNIETTETREMRTKEVTNTEELMPESIVDEPDDYGRLKVKINNLLWVELPSTTPLGQAEQIACEIFCIIQTEIQDRRNRASRP